MPHFDKVISQLVREDFISEASILVEASKKDSFKPPQDVQKAAEKGLKLRKEFGRGGLSTQEAGEKGIGSGVARATNLSNGHNVSFKTIKRMNSYFARHQGDKKAEGWGKESDPSAGWIAWLLWGGDPGWKWAKKILKEQEAKEKKS